MGDASPAGRPYFATIQSAVIRVPRKQSQLDMSIGYGEFTSRFFEREWGRILTTAPINGYHSLVRLDVWDSLPEHAGRVLDFGGGVGATGVAMKRDGRAESVVVADQVGGQLDDVDAAHHGDLEDLDFIRKVVEQSGPFDTILALDILEHLRDPWAVVGALHFALAPGGRIVASVPNVNFHGLVLPLFFKGSFTLTDSGILDRTHLRWFVRAGVEQLFAVPGLAIEEIRANIPNKGERVLDKLAFGKLRRFLALQYVVSARRTN